MFRWINGHDPRQYGLDFGLWARSVVAELIERKFAIRLGVTAVGELLAKLGLTPQKPLQRAYQRDPEAIEAWQRERYPAIARRAKASGGEVYFWDESGFRADSVHGRTWGQKGQTPVVERPGQRQSISVASAVNARGGFWYCTYQGGLNAEAFVSLLRRMMRRRSKPVHLVLDGLPAHRTTLVKTYVASTKGMLTLHFLPGYAPELNPDELVWSHMKRTGVARAPLRRGEKLQAKIEAQLALNLAAHRHGREAQCREETAASTIPSRAEAAARGSTRSQPSAWRDVREGPPPDAGCVAIIAQRPERGAETAPRQVSTTRHFSSERTAGVRAAVPVAGSARSRSSERH